MALTLLLCSEQRGTSQANLAIVLVTRDGLSSTQSVVLKAFQHALCEPQIQINTPKYRSLLVGGYVCATCLYFQHSCQDLGLSSAAYTEVSPVT